MIVCKGSMSSRKQGKCSDFAMLGWLISRLRMASAIILLVGLCWGGAAQAQSCAPAASAGTAPPSWETYCWLSLTNYNDALARSTSGQNLSFALPDGSTLSFNARVTAGAGTAYNSVTAPSWTGAAVGNTAFLGIPGRPILYTASAGARTITLSGISIVPPAGATASVYAFIVADAESSNHGESLQMTTNGGAWQLLDTVPPISGNSFPALSGIGSATVNITGAAGTVGAHIIGSNSPTTVVVQTVAGGLQGVMFAVRFASIKLQATISGARVNAADQFRFELTSTTTGSIVAGGTTSGSGGGPFATPVIAMASGVPLTVREIMAAGSTSVLSQYGVTLTCVNTAGPTRASLPTNVATTNLNIGILQFGEALVCTFANAAHPRLRLLKALGSGGRRFAGDQFTVRIRQGETVTSEATTSGSGNTVVGGDTGFVQLERGTAYILDEIAANTGNLGNYVAAITCSNTASGSSTALPTTLPGTLSAALGDLITCTITNSRVSRAVLIVEKQSVLVSDSVNGVGSPKAIPGAIIEYIVTIRNVGNGRPDSNSIVIADLMPENMAFATNSPIIFTNGAVASGLGSFNPATMVEFSSQPNGQAPFTYTPSGTFDPNVRGIRITPTGRMNAASSATSQPSFSIRFRAQVQ